MLREGYYAVVASHMAQRERLANFKLMLESLRKQTLPPRALWVGISCTPEMKEPLEDLLATIQLPFPVHRSSMPTDGTTRSQMKNYRALMLETPAVQAVLATTDPWLVYSDDDDEWHPARAMVYADAMDQFPGRAAYACGRTRGSTRPTMNYTDLVTRASLFCRFLQRASDAALEHKWGDMYWLSQTLAATLSSRLTFDPATVDASGEPCWMYHWRRVSYRSNTSKPAAMTLEEGHEQNALLFFASHSSRYWSRRNYLPFVGRFHNVQDPVVARALEKYYWSAGVFSHPFQELYLHVAGEVPRHRPGYLWDNKHRKLYPYQAEPLCNWLDSGQTSDLVTRPYTPYDKVFASFDTYSLDNLRTFKPSPYADDERQPLFECVRAIGFTWNEYLARRAEGKTARDLAKELLSRGYWTKAEEEHRCLIEYGASWTKGIPGRVPKWVQALGNRQWCRWCWRIAPTMKVCTGCHFASYCDAICQKAHWKEHKPLCQGLEFEENPCDVLSHH